MLQEITGAIALELDNYLRLKFATNENKVVVSSIVEQDGSVAVKEENKIILSIVNIGRDGSRGGGLNRPDRNSPVDINIYILFSAYFNPDNYLESLKFLSGVIGFFQSKSALGPDSLPALPEFVGPLAVELLELSFDEWSNLWGSLGAKYMPSVLYRIRSVSITDERIRNVDPDISGIGYDSRVP